MIDAKRYDGKVAVSTPLFGSAKLTIAGRDKTKLIDGLAKQVALVATAMGTIIPDVPIHGALCFVDADLPMLGTLTINDYPLLHPKALAKRLNQGGFLSIEQRQHIVSQLAATFPSA